MHLKIVKDFYGKNVKVHAELNILLGNTLGT